MSSDPLLLDTHVWVWMAFRDQKFSPDLIHRFRQATADDSIYISAYSLYEVAYQYQRGRLELTLPLRDWFDLSFAEWGLRMAPLSREVAITSASLPKTFHGDPGDRILAATAMTHGFPSAPTTTR